ncbi:hypothetical protein M427DRAFT_354935 [Gonapodya prolifera JEL478]|uniref:RRM domain-containing protein n=1 Tax=Gonapodya prolifera (strain JEL478) TaxID=1344416 RepID=A0A139ABG6_GONPJ|nr:hypothetical protein M427DRAFT_354935 [Gonapodya prolifera JEL478]|eukprot:KXS14131.1 hypothetical protein M427DRAFT_354935 [Gonapodya prolifera JEL478]
MGGGIGRGYVNAGGMVGVPQDAFPADVDIERMQKPARVVLVENLPAWVSTAGLWKVFEPHTTIRRLYRPTHPPTTAFLCFHDLRCAQSALLKLRDMQPGGQPLKARFVDERAVAVFGTVDAQEVEDIIGNKGLVWFLKVDGIGGNDPVKGLQNVCSAFGPLRRVFEVPTGVCAEFWDVRAARRCADECSSVGGVEVEGIHYEVSFVAPNVLDSDVPSATPGSSQHGTPASSTPVASPMPNHLRPPAPARAVLSFSDYEELRRRHGGGSGASSAANSPQRRSLPVPDDPPSGSSPSYSDREGDPSPTPDTIPGTTAGSTRVGSPALLGIHPPQVEDLGEISAYLSGPLRSARPLSHVSAVSDYGPEPQGSTSLGAPVDQSGYLSAPENDHRSMLGAVPFSGATLHEFPRRGGPKGCAENPTPGPRMIPKANEINLWRVMMGLDKRTTCMIRNIPNKYSQQMLIDFVDETHRGHYDFLYLRIDFKNQCNVGYAFINFIEPSSIVSFAHKVVGRKWSKFNSDKICTLSYANIQGKTALIEKFRNSSVMLEDPTYRPKLFHHSGPLRGNEAPFPPPTILLRKSPNAAASLAAGSRESTYSRDSAYGSIRESMHDFGDQSGPLFGYLAAQEEDRAMLALAAARRVSDGGMFGELSNQFSSLGISGTGPVFASRPEW